MAGDGRGRPVALNAYQAMALWLSLAAAEAAGEAARLGGYELTPDQVKQINRAIAAGAQAMVALVEDFKTTTDEQLEGAARDLGVRVLREVAGLPPLAN